jgi:prophage maintenance system killer protein
MANGYDIEATQDEKYQFVINIASGKIKFQEIAVWLYGHIIEQKNIS